MSFPSKGHGETFFQGEVNCYAVFLKKLPTRADRTVCCLHCTQIDDHIQVGIILRISLPTSDTYADTPATEVFDTDAPKVEIGSIDKGALIHAILSSQDMKPAEEAGSQLVDSPHHRQASEPWHGAPEDRLKVMEETSRQLRARMLILENKFREAVSLPKKAISSLFNLYFRRKASTVSDIRHSLTLPRKSWLASYINASNRPSKPSSCYWRQVLNDHHDSTMKRKEFALSILTAAPATHTSLIHSDAAMGLLCQKKSAIRKRGDAVAHPAIDATHDLRSLQERIQKTLAPNQHEGMRVVIDFFIAKHTRDPDGDSDGWDEL